MKAKTLVKAVVKPMKAAGHAKAVVKPMKEKMWLMDVLDGKKRMTFAAKTPAMKACTAMKTPAMKARAAIVPRPWTEGAPTRIDTAIRMRRTDR